MAKNDNNKEFDLNERAITLEVDSGLIEQVRSGEITHLAMQIDESNQNLILENIDGNLVLVTDEMPTTYHGCYFYNGGEFPYAIKSLLDFLILDGEEDECLVRIIDVDAEPGMRFNYQGADKPIVDDEYGDSCIWKVAFEVLPMPEGPKTYLMRWNPVISSFTEKDYEELVENMVHGMFRMNWSIREWEEARRGDWFYMMRTGDDKAELLGTDMPMYSKMELGARRVRRDQVPKLAELYKVDEKELMTLWLADGVYAALKEEDENLRLDAIDLAKEYFSGE